MDVEGQAQLEKNSDQLHHGSPPNQTQSQDKTQLVLPPILELFREQGFTKVTIFLVAPIVGAVAILHNRPDLHPRWMLHATLGLILFAIPSIFNGLHLIKTYETISVVLELLGSSAVILALVLVICAVPGGSLPWLLAGFFSLCLFLVPFFLAPRHVKK